MPTLDDTTTLQKNVAVAVNDAVAIINKDSDASSQVQQVPAALLGLGFTHAWVINFDNTELAAQDGNNADEEITLGAIPANSIVTKAMFVVTEAFAGVTTCNAFLGRTGDKNGYIESVSVKTKTAVVNPLGAEINTFGEVDVVTASDQSVILTFDPATPSPAEQLDDLTAGQLVVLLAISEIADFKDIVPAT